MEGMDFSVLAIESLGDDVEFWKEMIEKNGEEFVNWKENPCQAPLVFLFSEFQLVECLKHLITFPSLDPNATLPDGTSPLHHCCVTGWFISLF